MTGSIDYPHGVAAIDTEFVRAELDASHLIVHRGRAAFVDTGPSHAVPLLLAALKDRGLEPADVDWVFLTHIHLDHAGGAGTLLEQLPVARAAVHPRGAPHLSEPAKLIAGTIKVYGADNYRRLYGEVRPIPAERLEVTEDHARLALAGRAFEFLHTPGHALHHQVIVDADADGLFAGDTFGVSYRDFDVGKRAFIFPATTPSHFDPEQLHASIDRILGVRPASVFLTHYGRVTEIERLGRDLHLGVDAYVELARQHRDAPEREPRMRAAMFDWMAAGLDAHQYPGDLATRHRLLDPDIDLNVQGLSVWLDRRG